MGYKKLIFFFSLLFSITFNTTAQVWELGINAGGASYLGDLNPINPIKISGINAGAFAKLNLDEYWAIGLHYNYGKIKGDDAKSKDQQLINRNLSFYTPLNEVGFMVDFNFLDYFAGGGYKRFTPYLQAGFGGIIFEPKTTYQGEEYRLRLYRTEAQPQEYKNYALMVAYGAGVKYNISGNWSLYGQAVFRNAYTDYLDDVSGNYANPINYDSDLPMQSVLADRSGERTGVNIGTPNSQRGDFRKRDNYMFVGIGISYTFVSQKCYNF